jgi:hypothetical protein
MTAVGESAPEGFQIPLAWPVDLASQAQPVNQALFAWDQDNHDVLYAMFGHVGPPLWLSPEQLQQFAESFQALAVQPRGSFVISRTKAEEIWDALGRHLGKLPSEPGPSH